MLANLRIKFSEFFCRAILLALLIAMLPLQAFSKALPEIETNLQKLVMQKCDEGFVPSLSYPDGFQSQTLFTLCEAAFVFEPKKYAGFICISTSF